MPERSEDIAYCCVPLPEVVAIDMLPLSVNLIADGVDVVCTGVPDQVNELFWPDESIDGLDVSSNVQ